VLLEPLLDVSTAAAGLFLNPSALPGGAGDEIRRRDRF
jgi:hypothetical protein